MWGLSIMREGDVESTIPSRVFTFRSSQDAERFLDQVLMGSYAAGLPFEVTQDLALTHSLRNSSSVGDVRYSDWMSRG